MESENKPIENATTENVKSEYLDENGHFKPGNPGGGRPKDTPEKKLERKALKQLVEEYRESLAQYLPQVEPVFMAKVLEGDTASIREYHDRVLDKAKQSTDITSKGESIVTAINIIAPNGNTTSNG